MRVGVFGGTFDPPHVGHLILAEACREQLQLDKVLFIPAGDPWRKAGRDIAPAQHRLAMTRLAIESNNAFEVDDCEIVREGPSYSIDTLRLLRGRLTPKDELFLILGEDALARFRRDTIGYVFQSYHLIPTLTALENVAVPLELAGEPDALARAHARLGDVGLADRAHHYPVQLSGGEQQRVAVARAVCRGPRLLLADEPTGNLDSATGKQIIELLVALNRNLGSTLVLVTHDAALAAYADRIVTLRDGRIVSDVAD